MGRPNIYSILSAQADAIRRVGGSSDALLLVLLAKSISPKGPISTNVDSSTRIIVNSKADGSTERALILVEDLLKVLKSAAKKDVIADLGRITKFLERHIDMPLSGLLAAMAGNDSLVTSYSGRLETLLGHDGFEKLLADAMKDRRLKQQDAVKVAAALGTKLAPRTSKKKVAEQLLQLHNSLATFRAKKRAMAGRSAA